MSEPMRGAGPHAPRIAFVTAPSRELAEEITRVLVEEGVVACGNILPGVTSYFRWQGKVEREAEVLIVFKTTAERTGQLLERVPELHPYEVPEVLVFEVESGHGPYLTWMRESVQQ